VPVVALIGEPNGAKDFYRPVFGWTTAQPEGALDYIWNWRVDGQRWPEGLRRGDAHGDPICRPTRAAGAPAPGARADAVILGCPS
jgi:hypothetical protein